MTLPYVGIAMTPQPLDPRKSPWKRGDVCTRDFKTPGFVVNHTSEHLEVLWRDQGVENISGYELENIFRIAHADSLSATAQKTNLEVLQDLEALERVAKAVESRTFKNDREKKQVDNLVRRSFATDGCDWDKKNSNQLLNLALQPKTVGMIFKLRERLHRLVCSRSH